MHHLAVATCHWLENPGLAQLHHFARKVTFEERYRMLRLGKDLLKKSIVRMRRQIEEIRVIGKIAVHFILVLSAKFLPLQRRIEGLGGAADDAGVVAEAGGDELQLFPEDG